VGPHRVNVQRRRQPNKEEHYSEQTVDREFPVNTHQFVSVREGLPSPDDQGSKEDDGAIESKVESIGTVVGVVICWWGGIVSAIRAIKCCVGISSLIIDEVIANNGFVDTNQWVEAEHIIYVIANDPTHNRYVVVGGIMRIDNVANEQVSQYTKR
jgi:hypothetical protein